MMNHFIDTLCDFYPLSKRAIHLFLEHTETVTLPKGFQLIRADNFEPNCYFVVKGFARGYFNEEGRDITLWFASTGMTLLSMNGYMFNKAGYENIELLEESVLLKISTRELNRLFETDIELANLGRRMSDHIVLQLEQWFMERNFKSAAERYRLLIENEPEILLKTPLRHIASYLGISQVSLSRIRAGIQ
ncbi:MAG: Crp/Fnr family transcriptional regulator [Bacteroidales bacterium]